MSRYPGLVCINIDRKQHYIALSQIVSITIIDSQRIVLVDNNNRSIDINESEVWVDDLLNRLSLVQFKKKS